MTILRDILAMQQANQAQALNQLKLAQSQSLFPMEQRLKELQMERERQAIDLARQKAPLQIEAAELEIEKQRNLLINQGLLGLTSGQREFKDLTKDLSDDDVKKARRIKLGLDPRAVGSAIQTITEKGTVKEVGATEREINAAKEEGKLISQSNLKPDIERKVTSVVAAAKADAEAVAEQKSNRSAFNLYQTAFSGLSTSLGQTATGPLFGLLPALTSKQQIAEGAVAAVAPILKQMFRAAGEGTFTDNDQALLMAMVPTRKDSPEARVAKMENIDAIVRSKLKQNQTFEIIPEAPIGAPGFTEKDVKARRLEELKSKYLQGR